MSSEYQKEVDFLRYMKEQAQQKRGNPFENMWNPVSVNWPTSFNYTIVDESSSSKPRMSSKLFEKEYTPREIKAQLDEHVIGQEQAKRTVATAASIHIMRANHERSFRCDVKKSNILLLGPTGSGKTLLAETLAKVLDVPFASVDCTELTPDGYVGTDVTAFLKELKGHKKDRAVVFLDEVDKLASGAANVGAGVLKGSGKCSFKTTDIQQRLLKILEGKKEESATDRTWGGGSGDTTNMLFIAAGAFSGLEVENPTTEDLIDYGLMPEFIGRFPMITTLEPLSLKAMVDILVRPKNAITKQYEELFRIQGLNLTFEKAALAKIASVAIAKGTGARGLRTILEGCLLDWMFEGFSDKAQKEFVVTEDMVTV